MLPAKHFRLLIVFFCVACLLLVMFFAVTLGPAGISVWDSILLIVSEVPFIKDWIDTGRYPDTYRVIIYDVRMPRVILASLVGAALAAVGTALQGLFKNPMADPYVIGVSSGAALGASTAIVTGLSVIMGYWALPAAAFCGALLSTWVVYNIARVGNKVPVYTLLLAGVALSAFTGALTSFIMILNARELHQIIFWMLGSFAGREWAHVQVAFPVISMGVAALWFFARDLNAMLFGEDTAHHLGIDIEKLKKILLVTAALTVGAAVAVSGTIGFVGLIIPHVVRLLVGPDHRILFPVAALVGAAFMVATDTVARVALAPAEIPVGIITAFFGGPFFIYLLRRKKTGVF